MKSLTKKGKAAGTLALLLCILLGLGACGKTETPNENTESATEEKQDMLEEHKKKASVLDGKRIIFIGNSYMYYGQMVRNKNLTHQTVAGRSHDDGVFYELCKELGAEVNVVNWTFGSHQMSDFFSESCDAGKSCQGENHMAALEGEAFDYVVFQICGREHSYDYLPYVDKAVEMFKSTNPDTQFIYLYNPAAYGINGFKNGTYMTDAMNNKGIIESKGIKIVDWGAVVMGLIYGNLQVKDSKHAYNQESFIIAKSEKDGYHPNQLAGYITTMMTYMAITGDTATGLPYDFVGNSKANALNDMKSYKESHYLLRTSNYDEIIMDEAEMRGIQELIDGMTE